MGEEGSVSVNRRLQSRPPKSCVTLRRRCALGLGTGLLLASGAFAQARSADATAVSPVWTAYVANQHGNSVTPIDTATNTAGTAIPVGTEPGFIAITPDGKTAYVADFNSNNVTPITTATNTPGTPIAVGTFPSAIAITPDGRTAYVTNELSNTVSAINIATNTVSATISVGGGPFGIVITPDGTRAYVGNNRGNSVTPIDLTTGVADTAIPVGAAPYNIAITPDGATVYVANEQSSSVTPIATATNIAGAPIPTASNPVDIAITPDGTTAFVTNESDGVVTPINTATNAPGTPISIPDPAGIAITPDGKTAYVSNLDNGTVTPFDIATDAVGAPIASGLWAGGIAISPDQAPIAKISVADAPLGSASIFDASASTVAYGAIASYAWSFGDSTTSTTTTPTTAHTYAAAGEYTATVTETSSGGTSTTQVFTGRTMSRNGGPSALATQIATVVAPGAYSAITPFRICDTRSNTAVTECSGHTLGSRGTLVVQVTGVHGPTSQVVPTGALAVVVNLTGIDHGTGPTLLVAYPTGRALPSASSLNIDAGLAQGNLAVVPLSAGGQITIFNAVGSADAIVDVLGYFAAPGGSGEVPGEFHPMPPLRICDTRANQNTACAGAADTPLQANTWRRVVLSGLPPGAVGGTPSIPTTDAAAAAFNLTATQATTSTYLSVAAPNMTTDACPTTRPAISNVNLHSGEALPNRVISALGPHQDVCIYNAVGSVDFIVDVNGWFGNGSETTSPPGALFYAVPPDRICDTRANSGTACADRPLSGKFTETVRVAGVGLVPAFGGTSSPVAVVANLTGIAGTASTVLVLYPSDVSHLPKASDLNPSAHDVIDNLAIVSLATSGPSAGDVNLYNADGNINATLDVAGWFQ
jgi:YVTN family beta-propeller protein